MIDASSPTLYSLVYTSVATREVDDDELAALLETSRRTNEAAEITGMLLYRRGRFIQFLEGREDDVRALMDRIRADGRHTGVRVLLSGREPRRQFAEWSMGYERVTVPDGPPPAGFRDTFDDIDNADDRDAVVRATRELSIWFRARTARDLR